MSKLLIIGAIIVGFFLLKKEPVSSDDNYNQIKAELAHNLALTETDSPNITPDPDNKIPDLATCPICNGTRIQVHGDGHKTPCPYHGATTEDLMVILGKMEEQNALFKDKLNDRLDQIDKDQVQLKQTYQQNQIKTTTPSYRAVQTHCPCGCNHNVANCNCRPTCPGKRLAPLTYVANKPVVQNQTRMETRSRIVCSGGSCRVEYYTVPVPQQQYSQHYQQQQAPPIQYQQKTTTQTTTRQSFQNFGQRFGQRFGNFFSNFRTNRPRLFGRH